MTDHFDVDVEQLRAHARNVDAIRTRFEAVKAASSHIAQDDQAYGLLCGWISGILEGKHARQDALIAQVEKNLDLVVKSLHLSADDYRAVEDSTASNLRTTGEQGGL
nr:hypothetical protein [Kibdelosporangium sp. MJ126-NF4]